MYWIGLTVGIGSGKSTVAKLLKDLSYPVIDADVVAKQVIAPSTPAFHQIVQNFGPAIQDEKGQIDRKKLAQLVFRDKSQLELLESIIHPLVQDKVREERRQYESQGHPMAFYDVPLLFEKKLHAQFDAVVLVRATEEQQIERVSKREGGSKEDAIRRVKNQMTFEEKAKGAQYVLDNTGDLAQLKHQVYQLDRKILEDLKKKSQSGDEGSDQNN